MKTLLFRLSMPGRGSWNGRWSGEGAKFVRRRLVDDATAAKVLENGGRYYHHWDDGWCACVIVTQSSGASETRRALGGSRGFCGYDWMIDNILRHQSTREPQRLVEATR